MTVAVTFRTSANSIIGMEEARIGSCGEDGRSFSDAGVIFKAVLAGWLRQLYSAGIGPSIVERGTNHVYAAWAASARPLRIQPRIDALRSLAM